MGERKVDIDLDGDRADGHLIDEEERLMATLRAIEANVTPRLFEILDRGATPDRLKVDLPPGVYGEWVPNYPEDIVEKKNLGFVEDTVFAKKNALHTDATGRPMVADTIFMVAPMRVKEEIDRIRRSEFIRAHGDRNQKEEEALYLRQMNSDASIKEAALVATNEGRGEEATSEDIKAALNSVQQAFPTPGL